MAQRSKLQSQQAVPKTLTLTVIMTILVVLSTALEKTAGTVLLYLFHELRVLVEMLGVSRELQRESEVPY